MQTYCMQYSLCKSRCIAGRVLCVHCVVFVSVYVESMYNKLAHAMRLLLLLSSMYLKHVQSYNIYIYLLSIYICIFFTTLHAAASYWCVQWNINAFVREACAGHDINYWFMSCACANFVRTFDVPNENWRWDKKIAHTQTDTHTYAHQPEVAAHGGLGGVPAYILCIRHIQLLCMVIE